VALFVEFCRDSISKSILLLLFPLLLRPDATISESYLDYLREFSKVPDLTFYFSLACFLLMTELLFCI
jgi:hypothetical protein